MQLPFINDLEDVALALPVALRVNAHAHFSGRGVTIAILDSGFYPHPDLTQPVNRIVHHVDARFDPPRSGTGLGKPRAMSWHGTMVAGVCAGSGLRSMYRYASLAPKARLVLVSTGKPHSRHISEDDIARALRWVLRHARRFNIRVVNLSIGGDIPSDGQLTPLDALVEEAVNAGMVVVCAIGNDGARKVVPPASAPSAITVGGLDDQNSLDRTRWRMYRSNYGLGALGSPKPEVIAPAAWIAAPMIPNTPTHRAAQLWWHVEHATDEELARLLRTREARRLIPPEQRQAPAHWLRRLARQRINEQKFIHPHYQHVDGTSFAAAIVSSVVAQMLEANPALSPSQVKQLIVQTARPLPNVPAERQGAGVIDAGAAVAAAMAARPLAQPASTSLP